ncbi:MAG: 6,7-dimethyl-8-ribityllumazine synthase [Burkholderiaceae bacterium]
MRDDVETEVFNADFNGEGLRIGIVQARFNAPICDALREACLEELARLGVGDEDVFVCGVPGALEIPLALSHLAKTEEFDALVAIGAVVRGETYHFEVVSDRSAEGVMQVSLEFGVPIANAILTVDTDEQGHARTREKGTDAARAAVEMANLAASLATLSGDDDDDA